MSASLQLTRYLAAIRAGGSRADAIVASDPDNEDARLSVAEAELTDKDEAKGLLAHIITETPSRAFQQPTEAAAVSKTIQRESVNGGRDKGNIDPPMDGPASPSHGESTMPKHDEPAPPSDDFDSLVELAAETLRGDTRDALLGWFKAQPKSWPFMVEREQKDLAEAADRFARDLVKQACQIIAAGERPCIVARLVEYREKDGVEAKLKLPSTGEVVAALHEACGREVLVVTSGAEDFMEQRGDADIDPDQRNMRGIGDEYDEAA